MKSKPYISQTRRAGLDHAVSTVRGGRGLYRREPCDQCPWRKDQAGTFPAEAFRISAATAYDMATHTFACHMAGSEKPATCAGFLLRAHHNLSVRIKMSTGAIDPEQIHDGGHALHKNYRAMAIANGVDKDDPVIRPCR